MKRPLIRLALQLVASSVALVLVSTAAAELRVPQVPIAGTTLQDYLTFVGQDIEVLSQQEVTQSWPVVEGRRVVCTLHHRDSPNASQINIGIYDPTVGAGSGYLVLFGFEGPSCYAMFRFENGALVIDRFDPNGSFIGGTGFVGVDWTSFSLLVQTPQGLLYTQDARNSGGVAQALVYAGTAPHAQAGWVAWEESERASGSDDDFEEVVLLLDTVNATPVHRTSWGGLKARFR